MMCHLHALTPAKVSSMAHCINIEIHYINTFCEGKIVERRRLLKVYVYIVDQLINCRKQQLNLKAKFNGSRGV